MVANKELAMKRGLSPDEISQIDTLHEQRESLHLLMQDASLELLPLMDDVCRSIEFELQDAWHFPRDMNYHRFWDRPRCTCPKIDNEDNWPHGYYTIVTSCPLHGLRGGG
jgi:hypothetical protein